jgi:hypothetical protein
VQRFLASCKLLILKGPSVKNASLPRWHSQNGANSLILHSQAWLRERWTSLICYSTGKISHGYHVPVSA